VPAAAVLDHVGPRADLIVPIGNGEPVTVLDALEAHAAQLDHVRILQMHALRDRPYLHGQHGDHLRHVSYFLSAVTRQPFWDGTISVVPNHFSEVPRLLLTETRHSLVVAAASPPDRHGYFSLGTGADYVARLIGRVPFFVEANPRMPRTNGENLIHVSDVVGWCEAEYDLIEVPASDPSPVDRAIARLVAERVADGSTIQVGIGSIAEAILGELTGHRDLGIHTELLSDGMAKLAELGVVTGSRKALRPHKMVTTFCLGTRWLYDWLDGNGSVELLPVDWVNNPATVAREHKFVSINATTEVDLLGQCASETVAGRYWSGSGGQADFARGAMAAEGGQAYVVVPSMTKHGESRIRSQLTLGSVVTTSKNTVDHVVTEYGVAELRGRTVAERARRLIAIAHPSVRDQLRAEAHAQGFIP